MTTSLPQLKSWGVPFAEPVGIAWPVPARPKIVSYTTVDGHVVGNGATAFHASREGGTRFHAGMDLVCLPGDRVVAMEPGRVIGMIPGFVRLGAVVIEHSHAVGVYAEIALDSLARAGLKPGDTVKAGQLIGYGAINYEEHSMVHLELWDRAHAPKAYTPWRTSSPPPAGLLDPSLYLLTMATPGASVNVGGSPSAAGPVLVALAALAALTIFGRR